MRPGGTVVLAIALGAGCGTVKGLPSKDARAASADAPVADATVDAASPDAPASFTLTVKDYGSQCALGVNGGLRKSVSMQVVTVAPGTVTLVASGSSAAFVLGPTMWHHTDGDTGSGEPGTTSNGSSSASVTIVNAAKCVWVCCPRNDGSGCAVGEQCP